jgi:hypothetical protein
MGRFFVFGEALTLNRKTVLAFIAGAASAVVGIIVWSLATPDAMAQEGDEPTDLVNVSNSTYILALNDNLKSAGEQIADASTRAFYDRLINEYGLDEASGNVTDDWIPDIDRIQRHALTLPLQEAGKAIQDKDIAAFYARFLVDTGLATDAAK